MEQNLPIVTINNDLTYEALWKKSRTAEKAIKLLALALQQDSDRYGDKDYDPESWQTQTKQLLGLWPDAQGC
jgi:hypothetical protein